MNKDSMSLLHYYSHIKPRALPKKRHCSEIEIHFDGATSKKWIINDERNYERTSKNCSSEQQSTWIITSWTTLYQTVFSINKLCSYRSLPFPYSKTSEQVFWTFGIWYAVMNLSYFVHYFDTGQPKRSGRLGWIITQLLYNAEGHWLIF